MSSSIVFILFSLLLLTLNTTPSLATNRNLTDDPNAHSSITRYAMYVKTACNVTRFQNLCVRTLWPFAIIAKNNTSVWARASVAVTITDTKEIIRRLLRTRRSAIGKRERIALSDCRELFVDSLDYLYKSLSVLRKLNGNANEFQEQMDDLNTWLSAALTDEDTCIDGFEEIMSSSSSLTVRIIRRKVTKVMQLTSNALALQTKLANDGL